jgi:hypothetical protein
MCTCVYICAFVLSVPVGEASRDQVLLVVVQFYR